MEYRPKNNCRGPGCPTDKWPGYAAGNGQAESMGTKPLKPRFVFWKPSSEKGVSRRDAGRRVDVIRHRHDGYGLVRKWKKAMTSRFEKAVVWVRGRHSSKTKEERLIVCGCNG